MAIQIKDRLNFRDILTKEPFYEIMPKGLKRGSTFFYQGSKPAAGQYDRLKMKVVSQADFLRQFYPSGHKIMDPAEYPDIFRQDPDTKKFYRQPIIRTAFAFQNVIFVKQVVHLCGNDVQFELAGKDNEDNEQEKFVRLKEGWAEMDAEVRFFEAVSSIKKTGDGALVCFFGKDGKPGFKCLSYDNGDVLFPHFDSLSGELELFARKYYDYDEEGNECVEWVEVWDDKYFYKARKDVTKAGAVELIKDLFGLGGYKIVEQHEHGFNFVPVDYYRERTGPCWAMSQQTIENYEEAVAYFCESNKAFAFPIMVVKGDGVEFKADEITGAAKVVEINDESGEANFMDKADVSTAYNTELQILEDRIFEQSFAVRPPELKSGDLPGVAIKLLYSPAIEFAIHDCHKMQDFVKKMVKMVAYAYGYYIGEQASLLSLGLNIWIEPYIHQNDTELMTNLTMGVQNHFVSAQTASERASKYTKNDEFDRIMREDIEKRRKDLEDKIRLAKAQAQSEVEKTAEIQRISNASSGGQDVNTGNGKAGRPNRSGRTYDENGNWEGRDNWDEWNSTH